MQLKRGCSGLWIAAVAALADQASKIIVRRSDIALRIDGLIALTHTQNTGAAFSMLSGSGLFLTFATAILIAGLIFYLICKPDALPKLARAGLWMIAGGGLGNLYDRIAYGYVTDFIELLFVRFAVFNVADVFICLGAGLTALSMILDERKKAHERTI